MSESDPRDAVEPIAIVGMSGRLPGASDIGTFWTNLANGIESIEFFTDDELAAAGVDEELLANPAYVRACGVCEDADKFDARYFGFSPREAEALDPQQRVFLECSVEALEHAGLDPDTFAGPIGVYAGVGVSTYLKLIEANPEFVELVGGLQVLIGTNKDHLTTHVSYKLNLRGPSIAVQTACSTSLVAVVQACQALLTYQCDAALAGGVSIAVPQRGGYMYEEGGIDSPDGHCRAFDARAQGTVGGNGAAIVVLKRLTDARTAGDTVHAVIRGFAVNNDGAQKVGYTAPSIEGQAEVIALAQAMAGVAPDTISYIEAHGTGTALGDPIEIAALTQAFRTQTSRVQFCAVGSLKSNVGHLDCAAGVAGLIKTVLALQHRQIPPSLHFHSPNPRIDFGASPFFVNTALRPWDAPSPRRAGVSSFGIGGTNAHVIVEEAPPAEAPVPSRFPQLVTVSARSAEAVARARVRLADHLEAESTLDLADVCYTLHVGRRTHEHRTAFTCRTTSEAIAALRSDGTRSHQQVVGRRDRPVAFLFPGQGSQHAGMARGLYEHESVFRDVLDTCADLLREPLGRDLRDLVFCEATSELSSALDETWIAQPALFSVEYALARTWLSWGIRPSAMLGHSVGEYTAACLAGVFTLEDALRLVAARGRLVQSLPHGAMLAVPLPSNEITALAAEIEIAAINTPGVTTVAGEIEAIERFAALLRSRGNESKRLRTSHAFHSRVLDSILEQFRDEVARVARRPPVLRYVSNVTGSWIDADEAQDPDYYVRQLRGTVRFAQGIEALVADGMGVLLEVGPGQALTSLARQQLPAGSQIGAIASLGSARERGDHEALIDALGQLWTRGASVDWPAFHAGDKRRKVVLPAYPFERERYWIEPGTSGADDEDALQAVSSDSDDVETSARLYVPSWSRLQRLADGAPGLSEDEPDTCWVIFRDRTGLADRLAIRLGEAGRRVVLVQPGPAFDEIADGTYALRPGEPADYRALQEALSARSLSPRRVLHLWGLNPSLPADDFNTVQERGSYSLVAFVQGLSLAGPIPETSFVVVTTGAQCVLDGDTLRPAAATVLGPCRTIPQEYPAMACRTVDVEVPEDASWPASVITRLLAEAQITDSGLSVAYRGGYRWLQTYEPLETDDDSARAPLRDSGVYLITGGLGQLGLLIAHWIAEHTRARLILTSRTGLPPRDQWSRALSEDPESGVSALIEEIRAIEHAGTEVEVLTVDVADHAAMTTACADIRRRHGTVNGVFHCAGATRPEHFAPIGSVTRALWDQHFAPKAHGLAALARALDDHSPDFVVLMSSLSAILGGLGFLPYASANLFMDAFAQMKRTDERARWISINWDGWILDESADEDAHDALTAESGLGALECILASPSAQVIVAGGDLEPRLRTWIALSDVSTAAVVGSGNGDRALHARPLLTATYRNPENELEQQIADLWQQLLGVAQVGADDNFFELGGHSLLAIQLAARLRDRYRIELAVDIVFNSPTVAALSLEVGRRRNDGAVADDAALEALVRQVEAMDDQQLRALLVEEDDTAPERRDGR